MKLKDVNNIKLPRTRTTGSNYEFNVPMTNNQTVKNDNVEDDITDNDIDDEIDNVLNNQELINIATINAPFRKVSDIRKPPNTANLL